MARAETPRPDVSHEQALRELALVDRVMGLEAEVARLTIAAEFPSPEIQARLEALQAHVEALQNSRDWRVGNRVLAPARAIKRLRSK